MANVVELKQRFLDGNKIKLAVPVIIVLVIVFIIMDGLVRVPAGHVAVIFDPIWLLTPFT